MKSPKLDSQVLHYEVNDWLKSKDSRCENDTFTYFCVPVGIKISKLAMKYSFEQIWFLKVGSNEYWKE